MRLVLAALLIASLPAVAAADVAVRADVNVNVDVTVAAPPPAPAAAPAPAVTAEPTHTVDEQDRLHPGTLGLSLFASSSELIDSGVRAQGMGFALRLHPLDRYPVEVALETERDDYGSTMRTDWRIGYSINYMIPTSSFVAPYLVFPMGVNIVSLPGVDTFTQGYVGIGGGIMVKLGEHWRVSADARVIARNEQTPDGTPPILGSERVGELRGAAVYYF
jgi:hypothetical protein